MKRSQNGGAAGVVLVISLAALAAGLALDFLWNGGHAPFWIGAAKGAAATIGVAAAVFCALAVRAAAMLLRAKGTGEADDADA
jgi:hypothetical protein